MVCRLCGSNMRLSALCRLGKGIKMSKQVVVSVYDLRSQLYAQPAFVQNLAVAVRSFADEVKRPSQPNEQSLLNQHPEDCELWVLAVFDPEDGTFEKDLRRVLRGDEVKEIK